MAEKKFGVALGGGGVRGLAHIKALQTIDACGIKPTMIAGTSMGAIIGAVYASGLSGDEMRQSIDRYLISHNDSLRDIFIKAPKLSKLMRIVRFNFTHGAILKSDKFLKYLASILKVKTFEELEIPLHIVATNFWTGEEVVISSGELIPAIGASMAIPGIFAPVEIDGKVLVDGGLCNNLPHSVLQQKCDITIAVDVAPPRYTNETKIPGLSDAIVGMFDVLVEQMVTAKLKQNPPDIYVRTCVQDIQVLDFHKSGEVLRQADEMAKQLQQKICSKITGSPPATESVTDNSNAKQVNKSR